MKGNVVTEKRMGGIDATTLERARSIIDAGGVLVVPTDTVYGVACSPFNDLAIERIFDLKHRPRAKSIQVLLPSLDALPDLGLKLPDPLDRLSRALLPGAFSPITLAEPASPLKTVRVETAEDGSTFHTQAIRVPDSAALHEILMVLGPLAATSANLSGQASATSAAEASAALGEGVDFYFDAGPTPGPVASTVVAADSTAEDGIAILREGVIPAARIHKIVAGGSA